LIATCKVTRYVSSSLVHTHFLALPAYSCELLTD
jgi:hypothetical protein